MFVFVGLVRPSFLLQLFSISSTSNRVVLQQTKSVQCSNKPTGSTHPQWPTLPAPPPVFAANRKPAVTPLPPLQPIIISNPADSSHIDQSHFLTNSSYNPPNLPYPRTLYIFYFPFREVETTQWERKTEAGLSAALTSDRQHYQREIFFA